MEAPKVHRDSFQVVGIEVRTTNAQEMAGNGSIPKLWGRFTREGLLEKIPNRIGSDTIVLNTDYQSDKNGEYTYVLGAKVSSTQHVPAGMTVHEVPAGEYAQFSAAEESSSAVVVGLWQHIWSLEDSGHLARAYKTDYEVHHSSKPGNAGNAQAGVDIYIGIKK
ncbi:MAG: AraC family transcriptional regulator [Acidobacteriaceae bacterium]|nr:AraC family transcriptional regulator [Acidobacteriaceae bacterium]